MNKQTNITKLDFGITLPYHHKTKVPYFRASRVSLSNFGHLWYICTNIRTKLVNILTACHKSLSFGQNRIPVSGTRLETSTCSLSSASVSRPQKAERQPHQCPQWSRCLREGRQAVLLSGPEHPSQYPFQGGPLGTTETNETLSQHAINFPFLFIFIPIFRIRSEARPCKANRRSSLGIWPEIRRPQPKRKTTTFSNYSCFFKDYLRPAVTGS